MGKLIPMLDHVLLMREDETKDNIRKFWACESYALLLNTPVKLEQFIEKGKVLDKPEDQAAFERVIFPGWRVLNEGSDSTLLVGPSAQSFPNITIFNHGDALYKGKIIKTLNDLTHLNLEMK